MIKNFKQATEYKYFNVCIRPNTIALYEVIESWTEEFLNGDWSGIVTLRYNGSDLIGKVPKEITIETKIFNPNNNFWPTMYLRCCGTLVNEINVETTDLKSMPKWIDKVSELTKTADYYLTT